MRGTSIFSLPGQLIGAALGRTELEEKHRGKSFLWRMRREYYYWRLHRRGEQAMKEYKAGKCRVLTEKHLESLDNYLNLP